MTYFGPEPLTLNLSRVRSLRRNKSAASDCVNSRTISSLAELSDATRLDGVGFKMMEMRRSAMGVLLAKFSVRSREPRTRFNRVGERKQIANAAKPEWQRAVRERDPEIHVFHDRLDR